MKIIIQASWLASQCCSRLQPEVVAILENMTPRPNVGPPLGQRRRRWANSEPTPGQCLMSAWILLSYERHYNECTKEQLENK